MASKVIKTIKGVAARVTRADACGVAVTGPSGAAVSRGFISVELGNEIEDGEEFVQKNANGDFIVNERDRKRLKYQTIKVNFGEVHPAVAEITSGVRVITNGADQVGWAVCDGMGAQNFFLEVWTRIPGQACTGGVEEFLLWVWPLVKNTVLSNPNLELATATFSIDGESAPNPNYGTGPRAGILLGGAMGITEHPALFRTTTVPPADSAGYQAV